MSEEAVLLHDITTIQARNRKRMAAVKSNSRLAAVDETIIATKRARLEEIRRGPTVSGLGQTSFGCGGAGGGNNGQNTVPKARARVPRPPPCGQFDPARLPPRPSGESSPDDTPDGAESSTSSGGSSTGLAGALARIDVNNQWDPLISNDETQEERMECSERES